MELASKPVVLFATPTFNKSVSVDFHASMLSTITEMVKQRIPYGFRAVAGNQFVDVARNELVHYFLTSSEGYTDLLFMDADQGWDGKALTRLFGYSQGIVAALPPLKTDPPAYVCESITGVIDGNLFQAWQAGTGCMRIKREVFERMDKAYPELQDMTKQANPWPHTPYFQRGNTKYGFLGEDIFFCRQWTEMGEMVWIDPDVTFQHHGGRIWRGNLYDHLIATGKLQQRA